MKKFLKSIRKRSPSRTDFSTKESSNVGERSPALPFIGYEIREKDLGKLHKAAWLGEFDKVQQLAKKDPSPLDKCKRTPLHLACVQGYENIVQELLEWRAKTNIGDTDLRTPIMKAVECHHEGCVALLLEEKIELDSVDKDGNTCLHLATASGSTKIVKMLCQKGSNLTIRNKEGLAPLHVAVREKQEEVCRIIIAFGGHIDIEDKNLRTPLMYACQDGSVNLVKLFLDLGASTVHKDAKGWTADDCAVIQGHHACSQLISDHILNQQNGSVTSTPCSHTASQSITSHKTSPLHLPSSKPMDQDIASFGLPATDAGGDESGDDTHSKTSAKGVGSDSWGDDTDISLVDDKKSKGVMLKMNLAKLVADLPFQHVNGESKDDQTSQNANITQDDFESRPALLFETVTIDDKNDKKFESVVSCDFDQQQLEVLKEENSELVSSDTMSVSEHEDVAGELVTEIKSLLLTPAASLPVIASDSQQENTPVKTAVFFSETILPAESKIEEGDESAWDSEVDVLPLDKPTELQGGGSKRKASQSAAFDIDEEMEDTETVSDWEPEQELFKTEIQQEEEKQVDEADSLEDDETEAGDNLQGVTNELQEEKTHGLETNEGKLHKYAEVKNKTEEDRKLKIFEEELHCQHFDSKEIKSDHLKLETQEAFKHTDGITTVNFCQNNSRLDVDTITFREPGALLRNEHQLSYPVSLGNMPSYQPSFSMADDDILSYTSTEFEGYNAVSSARQFNQDVLLNLNLSDSTSLVQVQDYIRDIKHVVEQERSTCVMLDNKLRLATKEKQELLRKLENVTKDKQSLEQNRLDLEALVRSLQYSLSEQQDKKGNAELLLAKIKEQLTRKEQQFTSELEAKQQAELTLRNVQMEMQAAQNTIKELEDEREDLEKQLQHEYSAHKLKGQINEEQFCLTQQQQKNKITSSGAAVQDKSDALDAESKSDHDNLNAELYAIKMEMDRQRSRFHVENEELCDQMEELKHVIRMNEEALAHASVQFNMQLERLHSEVNSSSAARDRELAAREKLETELDSLHKCLQVATIEKDRAVNAYSEIQHKYHSQKEAFSQELEHREDELGMLKDENQYLKQRLNSVETKFGSLENKLHVSNLSLIEKNIHLQQLCHETCTDQINGDSKILKKEDADDTVQKLQMENAQLEADLKHEQEQSEKLQAELADSEKVRISLEVLCSNLKSAAAHLDDKLETRLQDGDREGCNRNVEVLLLEEFQKNQQLQKKVSNLKARLNAVIKKRKPEARSGQIDVEAIQKELELKYRRDLNRKLEEINAYLATQAHAHERFDPSRSDNETMITTIRQHLEEENRNLKLQYQHAEAQRKSCEIEAERFKQLYESEMCWRMRLSDQLHADKSLFFKPVMFDQKCSFYSCAQGQNLSALSITDVSGDHNDVLSCRVRAELDRSIAKHLEAAPHLVFAPLVQEAKDVLLNHSLTQSSKDYIDILKRKYSVT